MYECCIILDVHCVCPRQVLLINAVKDVASALGDLISATKCASGKSPHDPSMSTLKDSAKVGGAGSTYERHLHMQTVQLSAPTPTPPPTAPTAAAAASSSSSCLAPPLPGDNVEAAGSVGFGVAAGGGEGGP